MWQLILNDDRVAGNRTGLRAAALARAVADAEGANPRISDRRIMVMWRRARGRTCTNAADGWASPIFRSSRVGCV